MDAIIGRKLGMTQLFREDGTVVPVTVIEAGPCPVVQVRAAADGKPARVQLGFGSAKKGRASKAELGHARKAGLEAAPHVLCEFPATGEAPAPGSVVTVGDFAAGEWVKVTGTSKGRGFQGVVKRHHFRGGAATHGSMFHRAPGSIGASAFPSRVLKGMRAGGHMGAERVTARNLTVVRVDAEKNILVVHGSIPGAGGGYVIINRKG